MESESATTFSPTPCVTDRRRPESLDTGAGLDGEPWSLAKSRSGSGLRIAVVTETYPPEVNGVAMTVACVVRGLGLRGNDVQLVRPRQRLSDSSRRDGSIRMALTGGFGIPGYPGLKMGLPSGRMLRRLWEKDRPDVVHIATEGPLGWSALRAAAELHIPVVSEFRTNFHAYCRHYGIGWLQAPIKGYLRHFHNRTACTMVPTAALASELAGDGFENLTVVARGVGTRLFDPMRRSETLRRSWGASPETLVVLAVGRLAPEKNLGVLQTAFASMRRMQASVMLVVVGDGPSRHDLQARCPNAVFAGMRHGEDLAAHYASADVLLFPSVTETYGNVTPEAMASGLAVVAFDYAAAAQLIQHGQTGWLAPVGDVDHFVRLATQVVRERHRLRRMGEKAREVTGRLDWSRILEQIEGHYRSAIRRVINPLCVRSPEFNDIPPGHDSGIYRESIVPHGRRGISLTHASGATAAQVSGVRYRPAD